MSLFSFGWLNSSMIFTTALTFEFVFGRLLPWLLIIFTNWSSLYFLLRYSAILIISVLYAASICDRPLPPSFLFIYSLSISVTTTTTTITATTTTTTATTTIMRGLIQLLPLCKHIYSVFMFVV
jgi:hypothetical protein